MKIEFSIKRIGERSSMLVIISSGKVSGGIFPDPDKNFILVIDDREYSTSIKELMGGRKSIGKTFEHGKPIARHELCSRHHLKEGDKICIGPEIPLRRYRLLRPDDAASGQGITKEDEAQTIRQDAIHQLLAEKGAFTGEEFFAKLKQLQDKSKGRKDKG
jgi:hypothetical protein